MENASLSVDRLIMSNPNHSKEIHRCKAEIYRSNNILVRSAVINDRDPVVVTFEHYDIGKGFDRFGFGEQFLLSQGISAVHVLGSGNDWYQYDDIFDALGAVRAVTADARRTITYGSSMGGYAAVRLADASGADAVLALSPQCP